jgi:hypothetical protein
MFIDQGQDLILVLGIGAVGELPLPPTGVLFPQQRIGHGVILAGRAAVPALEREVDVYVSVLVRRLKPGKNYDDFVSAWYPDKGFGIGGRGPILARNVNDEQEIVAVALMDIEAANPRWAHPPLASSGSSGGTERACSCAARRNSSDV